MQLVGFSKLFLYTLSKRKQYNKAPSLCARSALTTHMLFYSRSSSVTAEILELGPAPALVLA